MNTWNRERRWRTKSKRGVSPIIATILLVAITVVLAAVLYILISGLTKGPGNTPLGTALALGTATEAKAGTNYYANFTVESAGGGITWAAVQLQVTNSAGTIIALAGATWTVVSISGTGLATAAGAQETSWTGGTTGGTTTISSTQTLSLTTTTNLINQGFTLNSLGVGSYAGTIHTVIP